MRRSWQWLRALVAERKWIVWVAVVLVVLVVAEIGVTLLLPRKDLNTLVQFEERPNAVQQAPAGARAAPSGEGAIPERSGQGR